MFLKDPNGARVNQILNPTSDHGVVTVDFLTSERSRLGYWNIQFEDDKGAIEYASAELQRYGALNCIPLVTYVVNM